MSENGKTEEQVLEIVPVQDSGVVLMPVMNIQAAKARLHEFREFIKEYLVPEEDYGTIPGTQKPTLYKPGADKLTEIYGLADDYAIESRVENYTADPPLFDYTIKCTLTSRRDGRLVGTGLGSCNSWEGKYRFRDSKRKCPLCGKEAIIKGKEEYGGGWLCFKKKDGCGAKFLDGDKTIEEQKSGKEINDDVPTLKNTILKMAKKRAKVDAVIAVTRSSGIFTQDMEDIVDHDTTDGSGSHAAAQKVKDEKIAKAKAKTAPKPQEVHRCLFYILPEQFNGNTAELVNVKAFGEQLNEVAAEGLRQILKKHVRLGKQNGEFYVPAERLQFLIDELKDSDVELREMNARKA